jgi:AcrR family transcriptional regulator
VANTWNQGTLARTHEGKPGLPRGRSRVPSQIVLAAQRERLLRAVIAAVSEGGYSAVTVADIVRRAKVSRVAFYAHFSDKEDCFLTATGEGRELMFARVASGPRMLPAHAPDEDILRAGFGAFLSFLASEPAFAKVFYIDMPAAGPRAADRLDAASRRFADINQAWHERARQHRPRWPAVPREAYLALTGATAQLVRALIREGRTDALPGLEDTIVALHLAVLAGRRWPAAGQDRVMSESGAPA